MKNILKTLGNLIFSEKLYIIIQILIGMLAVHSGNYTLAYGLGLSTILISIQTYAKDTTIN